MQLYLWTVLMVQLSGGFRCWSLSELEAITGRISLPLNLQFSSYITEIIEDTFMLQQLEFLNYIFMTWFHYYIAHSLTQLLPTRLFQREESHSYSLWKGWYNSHSHFADCPVHTPMQSRIPLSLGGWETSCLLLYYLIWSHMPFNWN